MSTLLLLLIYQSYYQIVKAFENNKYKTENFILFCSALDFQIKDKNCKYKLIIDDKSYHLYLHNNILAFITNYSPDKPLIVIYKFFEDKVKYWEHYYEKNIKVTDILENEKPFIFNLSCKLSTKILNKNKEEEEKNKENNISSISITIEGPKGLKKELIWSECKNEI